MEGTFEQLVEWARADLPELGASERLAAIRCVVEGDYLCADGIQPHRHVANQ